MAAKGASAAAHCRALLARGPLAPLAPAYTHPFLMKYIIIAISRLIARYLVACTRLRSYTFTATRRLPSLGHSAL